MRKVIIVGGGLAGLFCAIKLRKSGIDTLVIEKKSYPFHRVCGEYISNEVNSFLRGLNVYPSKFEPALINKFELTSINGKIARLHLDMGGFGISRFIFDNYLYESAKNIGVEFYLNTQVSDVTFSGSYFQVNIQGGASEKAGIVIGAFGKRSKLDNQLERKFFKNRSPYMAVKYHMADIDQDPHSVALHNFRQGYCGVNRIEDGKFNVCYLTSRKNLTSGIPHMEEHVLCENPHLEKIFTTGRVLFKKPEVINEISFETKNPVERHILMCGDAAGMITPLCGNGMAMAIHSAKIASKEIIKYFSQANYTRLMLENSYSHKWDKLFKNRLWTGRQIQRLFGNSFVSNLSVQIAKNSKQVANFLVKQTHGKPF